MISWVVVLGAWVTVEISVTGTVAVRVCNEVIVEGARVLVVVS